MRFDILNLSTYFGASFLICQFDELRICYTVDLFFKLKYKIILKNIFLIILFNNYSYYIFKFLKMQM